MIIERDRFYSEEELRVEGVLTESVLRRARGEGLRYKELRRGRRVYKGAWLLRWLGQGGADDGRRNQPAGGRAGPAARGRPA